jgi:hypothetical protein
MKPLLIAAALLAATPAHADRAPYRPPPPPPAFITTQATHNGSLMTVQTWQPGGPISPFTIVYAIPRPSMAGLVGPGTLLVDGVVNNATYAVDGTARLHKAAALLRFRSWMSAIPVSGQRRIPKWNAG